MFDTEVAVIGAGPFGLSISAHLSALGVDHVVFGRANDTYRSLVPAGMLMKSEPYASAIASPDGKHTVADYSAANNLEYTDRVGPLSRDQFVEYADWFTKQLVPGVRDETVTGVNPVDGGFRLSFANAAPVTTRAVVIATGVIPYQYLPAELAGLPDDLISHTGKHIAVGDFKGRRVAVVGAGQSALETAALLHENGASVQVIARTPKLSWNERNPDHVSTLGQIKRPVVQLCEGWRCAFWNTPSAFRVLPESYRIEKARTVLGPSGSWWLKHRIDGVIDVLTGHGVKEAVAEGSGVQLILDGPGQSQVDADHVIAGTGFRIDLKRLPFLPEHLRSVIKTLNGHPVVSRSGESSVAGLYFAGAPTVLSIGPSARFIAGTYTLSALLAKSAAQGARASRKGAATARPAPAQVG
ncbi:MAG TPA: NAD(P)-binding domain-containing protein [Trebonia sp.]|jgi:thioredoxin reductase|nr:NAD(P)-binding domain-containing protein [Trebonia sp.]